MPERRRRPDPAAPALRRLVGSSGTKHADQLRAALAFQRHFLRRSDDPQAWRAFEAFALELQRVAGTPFTRLVPMTAQDRQLAREELARGAIVPALAADPWCREARRL